jgi:hypothetical protein
VPHTHNKHQYARCTTKTHIALGPTQEHCTTLATGSARDFAITRQRLGDHPKYLRPSSQCSGSICDVIDGYNASVSVRVVSVTSSMDRMHQSVFG